MKNNLLALFLFSIHFCAAQQFIDLSARWIIDDCCYSQGQFYCSSNEFLFSEETVIIEGVEYYEVLAVAGDLPFHYAQYFRETNSQIFFRSNENSPEYLGYDFNLELTEEVTIGEYDAQYRVVEIDSVMLLNGEQRKRLKMARADNDDIYLFWIEGIGGSSSPFNPSYFLSLDCWTDFNCYHQNDVELYVVGDCMITSVEDDIWKEGIEIFPNPAKDWISVTGIEETDLQSVEIYNNKGQFLQKLNDQYLDGLLLNGLSDGMYYLKLILSDGRVHTMKFVLI